VKKLGLVSLLVLGVLSGACDRRVEPYVPSEDEPPPPSRPVRVPGLQNPTYRGPEIALAPATGSIRGTVRLGPDVVMPSEGVVFVIARPAGGGPPLAVLRLPLGPFPLSFEFKPADVMRRDRPIEGSVVVSARVDPDGDALTREADELRGEIPGPVEPGATGVELVLERRGG
jgi:hypothetical protein